MRSKIEVGIDFRLFCFVRFKLDFCFLNQAMKVVGDGDAALLKRDFRNAVKCYHRAMKLDESLCSKEMNRVETPIDAINNLILLEKRDVFKVHFALTL